MHGHGACRSLLRADGILGRVANESQSLTEQGTVLLAKQNHENKGELVGNFVTFEKQSDVCNFTKPFEFAVCGEGKNEETREKDGIYHDGKKFVKTTLDQNLELSSIENPFEMAKINCQGPVESYFGSFENNQPQELNLYESGKTFPINADDLFGESVFENIEEFIYDQNSFTAAANNSFQLPQPGQNDAQSFQYMTNETQSDDTAGILSNNFNDISLVKDKADYFFETGPPLRTASPSPEREKYQRLYSNDFASNVQLEIREKHRTFRSVDSKRSNSSEKLDDPRLAVSRKRDYSLSNDSGVGGCVTLESTRSISPRYAGKSLLYDCSAPGIVTNFSSGALIYSNQCLEFSNVSALSSQATRSNATARHGSYNNNNSDNNLNSTHDEHVNPPLTSSLSPKPDIDFTLKKDGDVRSENRETDSCEEVDLNKGGELNPSMHFASSQVTLDGKNSSKKTAYNEKWGVKVLKAWCVDNKVATDVENLNAEQLNTLLGQFWTDVRKTNGDYYGRNSLFNLRAMINKHLKGKPYCATFDIVTDERFRASNERLEKQLKILKGIGRTITHKQPISINDLRKMYDSNVLGTSNPLALLRKVWFEITLHFCHKGSESQEKLKKTSFKIYGDNSGKRFVGRSFHNNSEGNQVRMYETGGILCPVKSFELYNRKLHALQPRLFQQPRRKSTVDSPMWYGKAPIGEKALQQMMANISTAAGLSKRYTNHCVRTTALEQFSNSRRKTGGYIGQDKPRHKFNKQEVPTDAFLEPNSAQMYRQPSICNDMNCSRSYQYNSAQSGKPPVTTQEIAHVSQNVDGSLKFHCAGEPKTMQYEKSAAIPDVYSHSMDNQSGSWKHTYNADQPLYPPPAYNENFGRTKSSPLSKRMRLDHQANQQGYLAQGQSVPQDFQSWHTPDLLENKQRQDSLFGDAYSWCQEDCNNIFKTCSEESGAARSTLSPVSIRTLSSKGSQSTNMHTNQGFSETIVAGPSFNLIDSQTIPNINSADQENKVIDYASQLHSLKFSDLPSEALTSNLASAPSPIAQAVQ